MKDGLVRVEQLDPGHGFFDLRAAAAKTAAGPALALTAEAGYRAKSWLSLYAQGWADVNPYARVAEYGAGIGIRGRF